MSLRSGLERILEPIRIQVRNIVSRSLVQLVKDDKNIQLVQLSILKDEVKDNVERIQNYGFTSVPGKDAEAVVLFVNGNKDHGLVIACDQGKYRLKGLAEGDVAIYDKNDNYVKLTDSGIEVNSSNEKVIIRADGDIEIGNASLKKLINDEFQSLFGNHVHNYVGFVGTGTPTSYVTSSPAKVAGSSPVNVNAIPPAPPQILQYADDITDNEMTSKLKAQ